ncbi:chaperone NapD [Vreelandella sulfidaeris]|uniref:Chaperone NapD n=1 Tax=Vreelandella sulfidaeris TaxID=115553 RepID=A0A455U5L2_9GAMM|nr:nitrate reductase biosynthesis protein NapD [Halomonas sulfidaeris]
MNDNNIHISSLLVQLQPERIETISERCLAFDQAEIHATDPCGKMILVLETPGQQEILEFIDWLQSEKGVLSVSLVYHHVESAQELEQEIDAGEPASDIPTVQIMEAT